MAFMALCRLPIEPEYGTFQIWPELGIYAQRISGVITFIFIFWHVYQTRFQVFIGKVKHEELGGSMHDNFDKPVLLRALCHRCYCSYIPLQ